MEVICGDGIRFVPYKKLIQSSNLCSHILDVSDPKLPLHNYKLETFDTFIGIMNRSVKIINAKQVFQLADYLNATEEWIQEASKILASEDLETQLCAIIGMPTIILHMFPNRWTHLSESLFIKLLGTDIIEGAKNMSSLYENMISASEAVKSHFDLDTKYAICFTSSSFIKLFMYLAAALVTIENAELFAHEFPNQIGRFKIPEFKFSFSHLKRPCSIFLTACIEIGRFDIANVFLRTCLISDKFDVLFDSVNAIIKAESDELVNIISEYCGSEIAFRIFVKTLICNGNTRFICSMIIDNKRIREQAIQWQTINYVMCCQRRYEFTDEPSCMKAAELLYEMNPDIIHKSFDNLKRSKNCLSKLGKALLLVASQSISFEILRSWLIEYKNFDRRIICLAVFNRAKLGDPMIQYDDIAELVSVAASSEIRMYDIVRWGIEKLDTF